MIGEPGSRSPSPVVAALAISVLASLGLLVVYAAGGQPQLEGLLLGGALGGLGVGLIVWAKRFMPIGHDAQPREALPSPRSERIEAERSYEVGARIVGRRQVLVRFLGGAIAALGVAALFPIRSLGIAPGRRLFFTQWRAGTRAVDADGIPVRAEDVVSGTLLTVYPEDHVTAADSQAVLIGLEPGSYRPLPGREDWAPDDIVAFSKVCTHAGCPVGLYQPSSHRLFCPCHQSVFDVLNGAAPIDGPAARPLPQLPLSIDEAGYVVARGDFPEPIGPGFWNRDG